MLIYLNPLNWFRWIGQFAVSWFLDTPWRGAATALPAILVLFLLGTAAALSWSRSSDWRNGMVEAKLAEAVQREDFETVDLLLRRRMRAEPENHRLQYRLGLVREARDQHDQAVEIFTSLVRDHADARAALWLLNNHPEVASLRESDPERVAHLGVLTTLAIRDYPASPLVNSRHAQYLIARGDAASAVPHLEKAATAHPMLGLQAAAILRSDGQEAAAQRHAEQTLARVAERVARDPQNAQLRMHHAQVLIFLKRFPEATATLIEGAKRSGSDDLGPAIGEAYILWARSLGEGPQDTASFRNRLTLLQQAVQFAPSSPVVMGAIGETILAAVDEDDAQVTALRESLTAGTSTGISHFIRGTTFMLQDKPEEAAVHLELAARELPQSPTILNNLAVALAAKPDADLEQPLKLANQAIEQAAANPAAAKTPQMLYFYETRGQILLKMERYIDAIADLEKALPIVELRLDVHRGLAAAYRGTGHQDLADRHQSLAEKEEEAGSR